MVESETGPGDQDFTAVVSGSVHGNVSDGGSLLLRRGAFVYGDVRGNKVTVEGVVYGDVMADSDLQVGPKGLVTGRMSAPSLDDWSAGMHAHPRMAEVDAVESGLMRGSEIVAPPRQANGQSVSSPTCLAATPLKRDMIGVEEFRGTAVRSAEQEGEQPAASEQDSAPVCGSDPTLRIVTY